MKILSVHRANLESRGVFQNRIGSRVTLHASDSIGRHQGKHRPTAESEKSGSVTPTFSMSANGVGQGDLASDPILSASAKKSVSAFLDNYCQGIGQCCLQENRVVKTSFREHYLKQYLNCRVPSGYSLHQIIRHFATPSFDV